METHLNWKIGFDLKDVSELNCSTSKCTVLESYRTPSITMCIESSFIGELRTPT